MKVSAGRTGGGLVSSRLRFAFLRSHAALRCVSFGRGGAAGSLRSDGVVLPCSISSAFVAENETESNQS